MLPSITPMILAPGNLVAGLAGLSGVAFGIPWEVVVVVASLAVSWGVQLQQLNGFGGRLATLERKCENLEGEQSTEARALAGIAAEVGARIESVDRRLGRIETLLDQRTRL